MIKSCNAAVTVFLLCVTASLAAGCGPKPGSGASTDGPPFHPVAGVQLLMNSTIDPQADLLWDSVGFIMTLGEEDQEIRPETDEEWIAVRNAAVTLAESGNLLMMERRAGEGDDWMIFSRELIDTAMEAVNAAEAKDPDALFDAGGHIYEACLSCHESYIESDDYAPPTGPVDASKTGGPGPEPRPATGD